MTRHLIDKYSTDYAHKSIVENITPFSADWTITGQLQKM